jgi:hypothetical protein
MSRAADLIRPRLLRANELIQCASATARQEA